jgi:CRP-like cAMP-binding protein
MTDFGTPAFTRLLSEEDMSFVSAMAIRRSYRDGALVHDRGDGPAEMGIVVRGSVMLISPRGNGREILLSRVKVGQNFGDVTLSFADTCSHRAVAVGDTQIDHVTAASFHRLMERPAIAKALYTVTAYRLTVTARLLDDVRALPADVIFAKLLLNFHDSMEQAQTLEFVQENFAGYMGVSTVTLHKAMRTLKQAGLIKTGYRQIGIIDPAELRRWVMARSLD